MSKKKPQKASDVFKDQNTLLGKTTFPKAFPKIETLKVKVVETGKGVRKYNKERHYSAENAGEYLDCSNPSCYNGGFNLGGILRLMVMREENKRKEIKFCQGYEGSPKGKVKYDDCDNHFEIELEIQYK